MHGNEPRKDNEARKDRLIECTDIRTFEEQGVGCDPRALSIIVVKGQGQGHTAKDYGSRSTKIPS